MLIPFPPYFCYFIKLLFILVFILFFLWLVWSIEIFCFILFPFIVFITYLHLTICKEDSNYFLKKVTLFLTMVFCSLHILTLREMKLLEDSFSIGPPHHPLPIP